ncbi:MAG: flagella basal body P-ring formation protein FlgA [Pseudonocardiales bacterium]|jgi:pilus assembly protein CpaB|nr:flagella basal body P-ring formation protein FlgA [Pseudonocardiales bacterium]
MGRWGHHIDRAPLLWQRWDELRQAAAFSRAVLLRRVAAAALVAFAAVVALYPQQDHSPGEVVVVAAQDLSAGTVVEASQLTLRRLPAEAIPDGTAKATAAVLGRTLAAPVRRGEALTDVRLTGSDLVRSIAADPEMVSVPLRLADPDVATLLHAGATVDVVTVGPQQGEPVMLARGARVLAVLQSGSRTGERDGKLVLVALDPVAATRVAATSISHDLTVTVH